MKHVSAGTRRTHKMIKITISNVIFGRLVATVTSQRPCRRHGRRPLGGQRRDEGRVEDAVNKRDTAKYISIFWRAYREDS
jgi:hypothetical protein